MAELMITSETGMFHSACCCTYATGTPAWYGFLPAKSRTPVSPGKVDRKNRKSLINHYVTFTVSEAILRSAIKSVTATYATKQYVLGVTDCVSFSADVARKCRLRVPAVNITPYGLIRLLAFWNSYNTFK